MRLALLLSLSLSVAGVARAAAPSLATNRSFEVLPEPRAGDVRPTLLRAAKLLGTWKLNVIGLEIDGPYLADLARRCEAEPPTRALREALGRPVDVADFLLFLDDVLAAGRRGLRGQPVWVPSGRARTAGILLHPDDVFFAKPRLYGHDPKLPIDRPRYPAGLEAPEDGEPLGPNWAVRYQNPDGAGSMLAALAEKSPSKTFAGRLEALLEQLRAQGAEAHLVSTLRRRERGYLMYGAYLLRQSDSRRAVAERVAKLDRLNGEWGLGIPIRWQHPGGWRATREAARTMSEAYDVVYATEAGARNSNHYDGVAVDIVAVGLPRRLTLVAPDGEQGVFDLSDAEHSRDLSLAPELIAWVEAHFGLKKLLTDYPHWDDVEGMASSKASPSQPEPQP